MSKSLGFVTEAMSPALMAMGIKEYAEFGVHMLVM